MAARTLLAATTSATQSEAFKVTKNMLPVTITANLLAGAETADLQISIDDGATWYDVQEAGSATELTATNNVYSIVSPGRYRIDKDSTAGACGLFLIVDDNDI